MIENGHAIAHRRNKLPIARLEYKLDTLDVTILCLEHATSNSYFWCAYWRKAPMLMGGATDSLQTYEQLSECLKCSLNTRTAE